MSQTDTITSDPGVAALKAEGTRRPRKRGFAGFSWGQLLAGSALLGGLVWGAWTSREVLALKESRIVSVSIQAMANDFLMAEARSGVSPEQAELDTRHYMATLQSVLKDRASQGEIIIVSEAVVSGSVPDITPQVREAVGKAITASPPPRAPASAAPPQQPAAPLGQPGQVAPMVSPVGPAGGN